MSKQVEVITGIPAELQQAFAEYQEKEKQRDAQRNVDLFELIPMKDLTEVGQARCFLKWAKKQGTPVVWCSAYGWLVYKRTPQGGGYWQGEADKEVEHLYLSFNDEQLLTLINSPYYKDLLTSSDKTDNTKAQALYTFLKNQRKYNAVKNVLALSTSANKDSNRDANSFDADGYLLNCQNGVVDLRTGKLRASKPTDYMRHICSCNYTNKPKGAEKWQQFLDNVLVSEEEHEPDRELQGFVQAILGLSVYGVVKVERLFMAYGAGGNGKSTLFDSVSRVLGDYAKAMTSDVLVDDGKDAKSKLHDKAVLHGVRLAVMSELKDNSKLNTKLLKEITSTTEVTGEFKYRHRFEFIPTHTSIMCTNDLPTVTATDPGTWARLSVLPFYGNFRGTKADNKNLKEELITEASEAILSWVVDGAIAINSLDFKLEEIEPSCVSNYTKKFAYENNPSRLFIEDCCIVDGDGASLRCSRKTLYDAYLVYCMERDANPRQKQKFFSDIIQYTGMQEKRLTEGYVFPGIDLKKR